MTSGADAAMAARLFAADPGLGVVLRSAAGEARDRWIAAVRAALPPEMALRRVPLGVGEDRLIGGLDLAGTLAAGRPVVMRGLLQEGGVLLLAMAERLQPGVAARILAGTGYAGLVALDEGATDEERAPGALLDRLAFHVTLEGTGPEAAVDETAAVGLASVCVPDELLEAVCAAAVTLGIASLRAPLLAVRAMRAAAAVAGRREATEDDASLAARLVLGPRATILPGPDRSETPTELDEPQLENGASDKEAGEGESGGTLADVVLEAARAAIPAGLLAQLGEVAAGRARTAGPSGALHRGGQRGRPLGVRSGHPRSGLRLNLMETLRAAAPWQFVRGRDGGPVRLREADFRVTRLKQRAEATTVFVVDASGSAALNRLAEAKGAVELLLADCYVRRDRVAVLSFRGRDAQVVLPPTRSLVRAKRSLAGLPGGGGTPLAAGIVAGAALAEDVRRRGGTPTLVLLTDGRANVALDGRGDRGAAAADASGAARRVRASGLRVLLVDTSPRAFAPNRQLAVELGARYVALPQVDAMSLSRAVRIVG